MQHSNTILQKSQQTKNMQHMKTHEKILKQLTNDIEKQINIFEHRYQNDRNNIIKHIETRYQNIRNQRCTLYTTPTPNVLKVHPAYYAPCLKCTYKAQDPDKMHHVYNAPCL